MSFSKRERGEYIRLKMHGYILYDLGAGKITAEQAGDVYDLISDITTAGTPMTKKLAFHEYYLRAIEGWRAAQDRRRRELMKSKNLQEET